MYSAQGLVFERKLRGVTFLSNFPIFFPDCRQQKSYLNQSKIKSEFTDSCNGVLPGPGRADVCMDGGGPYSVWPKWLQACIL